MKDKLDIIVKLPGMQLIIEVLKALSIISIIAYLFYQSLAAFFILIPIGGVCIYKGACNYRRKEYLNICSQFKDGLLAVSASLSAGYSIENAFSEAIKELKLLYSEDSVMVKEFSIITYKLSVNQNIEDALEDLAIKINNDDARVFAEIFKYAKRSGGDLVKIIKDAAGNIEAKQRVKDEIEVMISAKRFEQKVMNVIPFGIIVYLNISMPGLLEPLYHNILGVGIMSVALVLYFAAILLSEKIIDIEV